GDGRLVEIAGGYSDWQRYRTGTTEPEAGGRTGSKPAAAAAAAALPALPALATREPATAGANAARASTVKPKPRLSFKETRELESMPATIEKLEADIATVGTALADPALYTRDPAGLKELQAKLSGLEDGLSRAMQRWADLERQARDGSTG
ncbi:MAG: ABC transporter C-terminal domain-containing protein, partial [bacterium]